MTVLAGGWWQTMRNSAAPAGPGVAASDVPATTATGTRSDDLRGDGGAALSASRLPAEAEAEDPVAAIAPARAPGVGTPPRDEPAAAPVPPVVPIARGVVPTLSEVAASGLMLPPLKLELHVYHEDPASRFVFINGGRFGQGQRLPDGPTVVEIRPIGVVLNQAGTDFLLLQQ